MQTRVAMNAVQAPGADRVVARSVRAGAESPAISPPQPFGAADFFGGGLLSPLKGLAVWEEREPRLTPGATTLSAYGLNGGHANESTRIAAPRQPIRRFLTP